MGQNYLPWYVERGHGPLVATAIHDGHGMRDELLSLTALSEDARLREEDPFTGEWTRVAPTRVVASQSRFELDLNRPREKAIYRVPEDAWGLTVWKDPLPAASAARSLAVYDSFYQDMERLLSRMTARFGRVVVFDLHTYNHRRAGKDAPAAAAAENPEVNVGTGTMDRDLWAPIVERFMMDLREFDFLGRHLDVRENVKFKGGHFPAWIHGRFPESVCVISIEFKKFFMDEWSGQPDPLQVETIGRALQSTIWGVYDELVRLDLRGRKVPA